MNEKKVYKILGMHCASCATNIESVVGKIKDVKSVKVNYALQKLYVEGKNISDEQIKKLVSSAGDYTAILDTGKISEENDLKETREAKKKMIFSAFFAGLIMVLMMVDMFVFPIPYYFLITYILGFPVIFIAGYGTHKSTLKGAIRFSANMDTLVTMGSLVPYLLSLLRFRFPMMTTFVEMATSILTLHLVGRFLEIKAKGRASQAIKKLLKLGAKSARIIENGIEREIPIEELNVGDIMIIKPGEKIPTDGIVVEGKSHIDESMATGESLPVKREKDDKVIGSTINKEGILKVKASKIGKDTFLSQIIKLVEECQGSKVPIQEFADKVTGYFVPVVILIAVGAFISWMVFPSFHIAIAGFFNLPWINVSFPVITLAILVSTAVLVISCPCALGLATPTALMVGSGIGAEKGILIRKGEAIQTMKDIKVIIFDKTGTITKGKPEVTDISFFNGFTRDDILLYSATIENASEHPLGFAIVEKAKLENLKLKKLENFKAVSGKGITGEIDNKKVLVGNRKLMEENNIDFRDYYQEQEKYENEAKTAMFVAISGKIAGIIAVADDLKENSIEAIDEIKKMGIKTAIITGDNKRTAEAIAKRTGVNYVISDVLPQDKVNEVKKMQEKYGLVAMVGDGINDAPALKQANVGIAIGTGTDIAIESSDITLIRGELDGVISAIKLSNETFKKIKQNYFWAWFYNAIAIPMAFMGLLHPIIGAGAMAVSSLNVVFNSMRLKNKNILPDYKK
jgi:Cu+-exporting ATPase